jgi:hypothetical protein
MVVTGRMNVKIIVIILLLLVLVAIYYLMNNSYERFQIYDLNKNINELNYYISLGLDPAYNDSYRDALAEYKANNGIDYDPNNQQVPINNLISTFPGASEEVSKQPDSIDKPEESVNDLTSIFPGTPPTENKRPVKSRDASLPIFSGTPEIRKKRPVKLRDASLPNSYNNEISEINNKLSEYLPKYEYAFGKMSTKLDYLYHALTPPKIISNNPNLLNNPLPQETPITSEENPLREQTIFPPENRIKPVSPLRMPRKRPVGIEAPPSEVFSEPVPVTEQPYESPPPEQPVESPLPEQPVEAPIVENFSNRRNNKYVDFTSKFNLTLLEYSPVF